MSSSDRRDFAPSASAVTLTRVGRPSEGLGEIQDLFGPDDLIALGKKPSEDGVSDLGLQEVRTNGEPSDLLGSGVVKHGSPPEATIGIANGARSVR